MGNIFQCCHALSNYFKYQDPLAQCGLEQSPLLSSEESECDSLSLTCSLEDDLFSVSTGVTNLQPEHFLFPDIILSSNPGGEVTLVEPMVCLLVSEEEDGDVRASREGRGRDCSEVETQTEAETQIGAEVQTQTETLQTHNETLEREIKTLTDTKEEIMNQENLLVEAQRGIKTSQDRYSLRSGEKNRLNEFKEISTSINQISQMDQNTELQEEVNFDENNAFESEQHPALMRRCEKDKDQNTKATSVTGHKMSDTNKKTGPVEPQNQTRQ
ncbi:uncharacterized protein LOC108238949 [Kryptolebias marmoratus]|uniref:uncharacterized protein LOC108238949 n=1 Tax=Kryptolebias marmoratus TaxID=37003 RepID=UPI0007F910B1|nr:uncharacterized protein LOC108238949 [Kryptolebias marmoratus]